ncbi:MAG: hypothetical protein ACFFAE_14900, partial [Candidatus Hodarchaeota archaeon]
MVENQEDQDLFQQLEEARKDLEFFIDLLTHDVSSQTMITYSCLEELRAVIDEKDEDSQFFLQAAFQSLLRAQMVIDQVRLLSKIKSLHYGDYTPIDMCGVVNRSITSVKAMFPNEKIEINDDYIICVGHRKSAEAHMKIAQLHGYCESVIGAPLKFIDGEEGIDRKIVKIDGIELKE